MALSSPHHQPSCSTIRARPQIIASAGHIKCRAVARNRSIGWPHQGSLPWDGQHPQPRGLDQKQITETDATPLQATASIPQKGAVWCNLIIFSIYPPFPRPSLGHSKQASCKAGQYQLPHQARRSPTLRQHGPPPASVVSLPE